MVITIATVVFGECCYRKWRREKNKYDSFYEYHYSNEEREKRRKKREEIDASWYGKLGNFWNGHALPFQVAMGVLIVIVVIMSIMLGVVYGTAIGEEAKYTARYESLSYQYENAVFEKDSDVIGNKQLYDEIQEYNETISIGKTYANDPLWGIFWPDFYNDLPLIELQ
jgi:hypothetical protein